MSKKTSFEALDLIEVQREDSNYWKLLLIVRGGQDKQQTRKFSAETASEIIIQSEKIQTKLDSDGKILIRPEDPRSFKLHLDMVEVIGDETSKKAHVKILPQ